MHSTRSMVAAAAMLVLAGAVTPCRGGTADPNQPGRAEHRAAERLAATAPVIATDPRIVPIAISLVDPATLTTDNLATFDDLGASGTNYDSVIDLPGVAFGEHFAGQTLSFSGDFDVLSGTPSAPLALVAGQPGRNLSVFGSANSGTGNLLEGNGPAGFPASAAIGEGAIAILFSADQREVGFDLRGGSGGSATVRFFRRDGSLISTITLDNLAETAYGFRRFFIIKDIAGVTIENIDAGGIGLDNVRFNAPVCGNGVVELGEVCDDNQCCTSDCQQRECPSPFDLCGDGQLDPGEECDDNNFVSGDGCDSGCNVEPGYLCVPDYGYRSVCTLCGNHVVEGVEECDDSVCCTNDCSGRECPSPYDICGDGQLDPGEECDDGNFLAGDGCSPFCAAEPGYVCFPDYGERSVCLPCGNGVLDPGEECDDGNTVDGDGCSSACQVEQREFCRTPNLSIPDNDPAGVSDDLSIIDSGSVFGVAATLRITHTYVGDLIITLTHLSTGRTITLLNRPRCEGDDIDANLRDTAASSVQEQCDLSGSGPAIGGDFRPAEALSAFVGESIAGTWRLTVSDNAGVDVGTLDQWCLGFPPTVTIRGRVLYYAGGGPVPGVGVQLTGPFSESTSTDATGAYAFDDLPPGAWTVRPHKSGDFGNGVSSLDAARILQRIVGIRAFTPEQTLACDVTGNGTLSALDAARVLQFQSGVVTRFPVAGACASDWLFLPVPAAAPNQGQISVEPQITSGVCESGAIGFDSLTSTVSDQNFSAILFGDCTGNWTPAAP